MQKDGGRSENFSTSEVSAHFSPLSLGSFKTRNVSYDPRTGQYTIEKQPTLTWPGSESAPSPPYTSPAMEQYLRELQSQGQISQPYHWSIPLFVLALLIVLTSYAVWSRFSPSENLKSDLPTTNTTVVYKNGSWP
jgi:hypothetical protein